MKKIMDNLDFFPVFHPYIAQNELDMFPYFKSLVKDGFVRVSDYNEFLHDNDDKELYKNYFMDIHDEIRKRLLAKGGKKQLDKLVLPPNQNIFTFRKARMSLGDVHMILMAFFMQIPVILTDDSDIDMLRSITMRKMGSDTYKLDIYNTIDVLLLIAKKTDTEIKKDELVNIMQYIGERSHRSELTRIWNEYH